MALPVACHRPCELTHRLCLRVFCIESAVPVVREHLWLGSKQSIFFKIQVINILCGEGRVI